MIAIVGSGAGRPGPEGVSTPGHGQGEGPFGSKLSRSDDADDDGRGRSERSERSPSGAWPSRPAYRRLGIIPRHYPGITPGITPGTTLTTP